MELLSHLVTLVSIIIGIGLTEMFGNLHRLIRHRARVTWDWLPVAWTGTLLLLVINYWWSIYLGITGYQLTSNAAEFGLRLVSPILLFLTTASVLPNFDPGADWDMRRHYDEQRTTFILTFILYQCSTWINAAVVGTLGWNVVSVVRAIILALLVTMLLLKQRRWDWIGVVAIFLLVAYRLSTQAVR